MVKTLTLVKISKELEIPNWYTIQNILKLNSISIWKLGVLSKKYYNPSDFPTKLFLHLEIFPTIKMFAEKILIKWKIKYLTKVWEFHIVQLGNFWKYLRVESIQIVYVLIRRLLWTVLSPKLETYSISRIKLKCDQLFSNLYIWVC